ncbi:hypothetical protein HM1_1684 [Heliomicrobium modesticaldum Ice1]|uniref:Uncharacterized protein n=1 Tax=Heliobacterium modesticaldum (strain ATCC 51547 / Ice1) TaxID=498761 RepID=B0TE59_HELMI|nr:hypothetical protein [Heliomicrobium modesticaldum]ABZ84254.1 hypothetical protein HM1_1684 [Heliomicrobium modesticaldum Ice1]
MAHGYRGFWGSFGVVAGLVIALIVIGAFYPTIIGYGYVES